jgi:hypothetical protein
MKVKGNPGDVMTQRKALTVKGNLYTLSPKV